MVKKQNKALPLVAGAVIHLCIGIIYIWSIFQPSVMEYYEMCIRDSASTSSPRSSSPRINMPS